MPGEAKNRKFEICKDSRDDLALTGTQNEIISKNLITKVGKLNNENLKVTQTR